MSRCFPYPPPGYSGNRAINDALIESIKLQREREKPEAERKKEKKREKKERKDKRRENREKKREKKERKEKRREQKEKAKPTSSAIPHDEPAQKFEKSWAHSEGGHKSKSRDDNPEQLERSDLTEEYGQPIGFHNPSYSSDSTQNSNKRKRPSSPINGCRNNGNTFRIRLPLQKHKGPVTSASKEELCSTSGRTDLLAPAQHKQEVACAATRQRDICFPPLVTDSVVKGLAARPGNALNIAREATRHRDICSPPLLTDSVLKGLAARPDNSRITTVGKARLDNLRITTVGKARLDNSHYTTDGKARPDNSRNTTEGKARPDNALNTTIGKAEIFAQDKKPIASGSTSCHDKLKRESKLYMELIRNWVPPPLKIVLPDSDDQEWLFGGKRQKREGEKRLKDSSDVSCCGSYALQPCARYLPEADIYALPYTVPF